MFIRFLDSNSLLLPRLWRNIATPMAQHCHAYGTTLPHLWHDCAKAMARLCHFDGKKLAMYSFLFPVLNEMMIHYCSGNESKSGKRPITETTVPKRSIDMLLILCIDNHSAPPVSFHVFPLPPLPVQSRSWLFPRLRDCLRNQ